MHPRLTWVRWWALFAIAAAVPSVAQSAERVYDVSRFDSVTISIPADVQVQSAGKSSVRVVADLKVLDTLSVLSSNRQLRLESTHGFSTRVPVKVLVEVESLRELNLHAAGDVQISQIKGDRLVIASQSAGNIVVQQLDVRQLKLELAGSENANLLGVARHVEFLIDGAAVINARGLASRNAVVKILGSGELLVNAAESLDVTIEGAGAVRYVGNPTLYRQIRGTGDIVPE